MCSVTKKQLTEDNNVFFFSQSLSWTHGPQDCTQITRTCFCWGWRVSGWGQRLLVVPKSISAEGFGWGQEEVLTSVPRTTASPRRILQIFSGNSFITNTATRGTRCKSRQWCRTFMMVLALLFLPLVTQAAGYSNFSPILAPQTTFYPTSSLLIY